MEICIFFTVLKHKRLQKGLRIRPCSEKVNVLKHTVGRFIHLLFVILFLTLNLKVFVFHVRFPSTYLNYKAHLAVSVLNDFLSKSLTVSSERDMICFFFQNTLHTACSSRPLLFGLYVSTKSMKYQDRFPFTQQEYQLFSCLFLHAKRKWRVIFTNEI